MTALDNSALGHRALARQPESIRRSRASSSRMKPDALLVQASSRSWAGGSDRCMRLLDGKPLLLRTLERVRSLFPQTPIRLVAPEFDRGGLDHIASAVTGCEISYGFDDKPLKRMIKATRDLGDDAVVIRVDGLHCFFLEDVIRALFDAVVQEKFAFAKSPDDFPPPLTGEVWRVGGLRHIDRLLSSWPVDRAAPHYVHPKYLATRKEAGLLARIVPPPPVPDEHLKDLRTVLTRAIAEDHYEVTSKSIPAGDQISFHYVLASRHLKPTDDVLDIASGKGHGGNIMANVARAVTCADLDTAKLDEARRLFPRGNLKFVHEDVMAMSFPDASFDVVVSMETIEHVDDVVGYLAEIRRVLKPGGRAILSTPQNSIGRVPLVPAHVREFSLEELRSYCRQQFEVETVIGLKAGTIYFEDDPIGSNSMIFLRKPLAA